MLRFTRNLLILIGADVLLFAALMLVSSNALMPHLPAGWALGTRDVVALMIQAAATLALFSFGLAFLFQSRWGLLWILAFALPWCGFTVVGIAWTLHDKYAPMLGDLTLHMVVGAAAALLGALLGYRLALMVRRIRRKRSAPPAP